MSKSSPPPKAMSSGTICPDDFAHSPVHYAVAVGDHASLTRIISSLPKLAHPTQIRTESDSITQEIISDQISAALDRRDNPSHETPLHLSVRLNDTFAAKSLAGAGADISLQNSAGWNSLQEAVIRRCGDIVSILVQHHHSSAWSKWRRRLPRLVAALQRMRDFYMEISFHFESSIVPFVDKIAPSDTYRIWKRDGNLRADTSLAGYDGLKIQRANQSFMFYGDGDEENGIQPGSLLVLNHDDKKIFDAFENAGAPLSDLDVSNFCKQTSIYRPGMDVTKATLVGRTNWRGQEKTETIGSWKSRIYEVQNVVFSFRSRKLASDGNFIPGSEQILPLELEEDSEEGFLVAENPRFSVSESRNSCSSNRFEKHRHSSFVREESRREFVTVSRKSVDIIPEGRGRVPPRAAAIAVAPPPQTKEKEFVKSLKPSIWLTEQFPLKTEELMPLLDILANKVKAVRRLRELLTTTFPTGTFPVKVAIPVVPTVRVVITFTKFVELQPIEKFYTPLSSPSHFVNGEDEATETDFFSLSSSSSSSSFLWMSKSGTRKGKQQQEQQHNSKGSNGVQQGVDDPFTIPAGYNWSCFDDKSKEMRKSKSMARKIK